MQAHTNFFFWVLFCFVCLISALQTVQTDDFKPLASGEIQVLRITSQEQAERHYYFLSIVG